MSCPFPIAFLSRWKAEKTNEGEGFIVRKLIELFYIIFVMVNIMHRDWAGLRSIEMY